MCVRSVSGSTAARALASSRKSTERKSTSRPLGSSGLRRETPTTSQPAERNFSIAATPSKPLAPVTRTLFRTIFLWLITPMIDLVLMRRFARRRRLYERCVGLDPFCDVGRGVAVEGPIEIFGYVADVRRREDVIQLAERMVGLQRLDIEYINGGAGHPPPLHPFHPTPPPHHPPPPSFSH